MDQFSGHFVVHDAAGTRHDETNITEHWVMKTLGD